MDGRATQQHAKARAGSARAAPKKQSDGKRALQKKPRKNKRQPPPTPPPQLRPAQCHLLALLSGDALECCLWFLDAGALHAIKPVCRAFCAAARRLSKSTVWLAAHTSIHGLLEREWANERQQVAAVMWRVARFPSECIHKLGGTHRLTAAHVAAIRHDSGELMRALMQAIESDDGSAHGTPHGIPRSGAAARKRKKGARADLDRRATKGRKIKYVVHPKLQEFCCPVPRDAIGAGAARITDELFASLFGGTADLTPAISAS